jgi:hypothetical protein
MIHEESLQEKQISTYFIVVHLGFDTVFPEHLLIKEAFTDLGIQTSHLEVGSWEYVE